MGSNSHVALGSRQLQGFWLRTEPLLTNRMREILTYGSVGGVGRKPGPYPAPDAAMSFSLHIGRHWRGASDVQRSAKSQRTSP
jgi:hypothetical protein